MKKSVFSVILVLSSGLVFSQATQSEEFPNEKVSTNTLGQQVITTTAIEYMKTSPVRDWPVVEDNVIPLSARKKIRNEFKRDGYLEAQKAVTVDPVVQTENGTRAMRSPIVNFNGLSGSGYPPDPSGAAGPNHYVQAVNTSFRVYDKSGNPVLGGGPFNLSSLWPGSSNQGDPIVMYDRHADRWFISQFQFSPNRILIAISETADPTGAYYAYSFTLTNFPDYPKYSIWWDGYYMTSNSNHTAVVFERDKMLAGDPSAQAVVLSLPSLGNGGFRSPLPADADGPLPPNGTPCYFFNLEDNAFTGVAQDQIEIYEMTTDWSNTANTQVVSSQQLPVPSFDAVFSGGWSNIAQPGTNQGLDAIMGVFMYRAQHMRWVNYNSIVLSHAVDLGANRSGVRWYELRDAHDGNWTVHQSGTYAPDNTSRWMSSAAMDNLGNIGMAYSVSDKNANIYPGLRYTGRLYQDAPGDMTFMEKTAINGQSSQTFTDRYGDYSHLSLDPDGSTFWYTGEYMGTGGNPRTRIFSFNLQIDAGLDAMSPYYKELTLKAYQKGSELVVHADGVHGEEKVTVDVIGMNGKIILSSSDKMPTNKVVDHTFDVSALQSGIYFVRIGNGNFQKAERLLIKK